MPLHDTAELKVAPTSQVESSALDAATGTYQFPATKHDSETVYQAIHEQLVLDGNSQQNLATFCTTWIEPEVKQLMDESADKNMIDKDEYPQTAAISRGGRHDWVLDHWIQRSGDTRRPRAEVELAEAAACKRKVHRYSEPDHGSCAGMLAQILPLFRR
jgi:hypothetical protein